MLKGGFVVTWHMKAVMTRWKAEPLKKSGLPDGRAFRSQDVLG